MRTNGTYSVIAISILSGLTPPVGTFPPLPRNDMVVVTEVDKFELLKNYTSRSRLFRSKKLSSSTGNLKLLDQTKFLKLELTSMGEPTTIAVHRCRFVDYNPSAITALAFPPSPLPSAKGKSTSAGNRPLKFGTLAVGHANGNIDLCEWVGHESDSQCTQAWVVRKVGSTHTHQQVKAYYHSSRRSPAFIHPRSILSPS
jgi:hypothetical protein